MSSARAELASDLGSLLAVRLRSIGDAVLMTSLLQAIRAERPAARIAVLLEPAAAALLAGQPVVDQVITVRRGIGPRLSLLRALRAARFEVALDLHGGPTAALLTRFCGAGLRIGLAAYRQRRAYDLRLPSPFKGAGRALTLHTVESNLAIARSLGLDPAPGLGPRLSTLPAGEREADAAIAASGLAADSAFVVLHPGAALASKRWPGERFAAVAQALAGDGHEVAVVAPPGGEPGLVAGGAAGAGVVLRWLPPLTLPGLLAVLRRARLLIGNDSGPAHMAAAVGTRTVTVFGSQDPRVWRPWGAGHHVLSAGLACSPCRGTTCANPRPLECLDLVPAAAVLAAAREALGDG